MVEGTHTSEEMYGLGSGAGKGSKIWAGLVSIADTNTIDTGLTSIDAVAHCPQGTVAGGEGRSIATTSGGTITFKTHTFTTDSTATCTRYLIVVGRSGS